MENCIPNHVERFFKRSLLTLFTVVFFHELLPCQINQIDSRSLKREGGNAWFFPNGMPVLSAQSHVNAHEYNEGKELAARNSFLDTEYKAGMFDTGIFRPMSGPYGGTVRSIITDPGGWLFVATDAGVYISTDDGSHWDSHLFPSQLYNSVEPVTVLGPNVIVAETDFNNFILIDRGQSWSYLFEDVQGFVVDTNGEIYAGSNHGGVKKSTDTAKSWTPFVLEGKKIFKVVLCGGGQFVCSSDSGLFFSSDNGMTWIFRTYRGTYNWNPVSDRNGHLFIIQDFQVYRSSDFGNSWNHIILPDSDPWEDVYRIYVEEDNRVIVVTDRRIMTSTDAGETWNTLVCSFGMPLTVGRDSQGNLLAGSFYGIYRRNHMNGEWEELNNGIHARRIEEIEFTSAGSILVLSLGQCFRSTDNGSSWSRVYLDSTVRAYPYAPMLSCSYGSVFIAASFDGQCGLLRSNDDGVLWEKISVLSNYYAIYGITEGVSGEVLASTYCGMDSRTFIQWAVFL